MNFLVVGRNARKKFSVDLPTDRCDGSTDRPTNIILVVYRVYCQELESPFTCSADVMRVGLGLVDESQIDKTIGKLITGLKAAIHQWMTCFGA